MVAAGVERGAWGLVAHGSPPGETPGSTAGGTPAATEARLMESINGLRLAHRDHEPGG